MPLPAAIKGSGSRARAQEHYGNTKEAGGRGKSAETGVPRYRGQEPCRSVARTARRAEIHRHAFIDTMHGKVVAREQIVVSMAVVIVEQPGALVQSTLRGIKAGFVLRKCPMSSLTCPLQKCAHIFLVSLTALLGNAPCEATEKIAININVTGASNTKCDVIPNVTCYWEQARPQLGKKSTMIGSAINGSTADEFNRHFAERVQPYYDRKSKYNILVLQTGGNDILANASAKSAFENLKAVVSKWKALGPRSFAVVATVPRFGYSQSQLAEADKLNRLILSEQAFGATFDIAGIRELNHGTGCPPVNLSPDCSHLTSEGNMLVSRLFVAAINSVLDSL
jgi:hypothetical protein